VGAGVIAPEDVLTATVAGALALPPAPEQDGPQVLVALNAPVDWVNAVNKNPIKHRSEAGLTEMRGDNKFINFSPKNLA
jgi:hypothetical protein